MVSLPDWTDGIFTDEEKEEIDTGNGWSTGIVSGPNVDEPQRVLVEHFDDRFPGQARVYFYSEEREEYAYETESDRPTDSSALFVVSYTDGEMAS